MINNFKLDHLRKIIHLSGIVIAVSVLIFLILTFFIGRDLVFNRAISDYIPFLSPNLTQIPIDYKDCSQYHKQNSLSQLKCSLSFSDKDNLFKDCSDNGGNITSNDLTGEKSCKVIYYKYSFDSWPKSFNECIKLFGLEGNPDMCGEIIPSSGVYHSDQNKDQMTSLVDQCLNNGGSTILLPGSDVKFCGFIFNK